MTKKKQSSRITPQCSDFSINPKAQALATFNVKMPIRWSIFLGSMIFMAAPMALADISGTVFHDYNNNGTRENIAASNNGTSYVAPFKYIEAGLYGVTVSAYAPDASTPTATATSNVSGAFTLTGLTAGTQYRLEYT